MCREMSVFFILIERLNSKINTLTMQYFTDRRHNTPKTHVPILTALECLHFIQSKFTRNAQNIFHLNH